MNPCLATLCRLSIIILISLPRFSHGQPWLVELTDVQGEVVGAEFLGDQHRTADWLVSQKDPRSHLHKLPKLSTLGLRGHKITARELEYVATLRTVTSLTIGDSLEPATLEPNALSRLGSMVWLEALELWAADLKEEDFSRFPELPSLSSLRAGYISSFAPLRIGSESRLDDGVFRHISHVRSLEELWVGGEFSDNAVRQLQSLDRLEELRLASSLMTNDAIVVLSKLRSLRTLHLTSPRLTDGSLRSLGGLEHLERLQIKGRSFTGESLRLLTAMRELRELQIDGMRSITKNHLESVQKMENLESLVLWGDPVGDHDIEGLRGHPRLRRIGLDASFGRRSLDVLKTLPKLEAIYVSRGEVESKIVADEINRWIASGRK